MNVALFAGQGAQTVGMGKDLFEAYPECAALFAEADRILGGSLSSTIFNGPMEELTKTNVCQPAIFVVSAAAYTAFCKENPNAKFDLMAGLSLGEWTALWAGGAVSFAECVRILEARGRFMQEACEANPSGMVSVLKLAPEAVEAIAAETGCSVTNYNSAAQIVLGGTHDQVAAAAAAVSAKGGRAVVLKTAGAYHSSFMAPAAEKLTEVLAKADIQAPRIPVLSNYTGKIHGDADEIRTSMISQIAHAVRWTDDMAAMGAAGATAAVEFGPGVVLTGLLKRTLPSVALHNVGTADQAKAVAAVLA